MIDPAQKEPCLRSTVLNCTSNRFDAEAASSVLGCKLLARIRLCLKLLLQQHAPHLSS
ncbi:hypothetical protein NIES37_05750 [Tolypothrix tenuis PCC 7101]|uniref:Uncharacterized protein n=1 Tax=Tolypothrix tenuis PCC 7101 TaxID=231146 RepID=A0A1Z4MTA0_9CYAN|nr:hypothetical protein NIES37_05750 [Tolypothrix tenuis PCC 7101]BAZ72852.1 hypothetical protein NIES50_14090 [Aulosira laxa NIES-50]